MDPLKELQKKFRKYKNAFSDYYWNIRYPKKVLMMWFKEGTTHIDTGYRLDSLYQRTLAADQMGYDVVLEAKDDGGLYVYYRQKLIDRPNELI